MEVNENQPQGGKMIKVQQVINRLEAMPKSGVSYDEKGRHGWRNPIRGDTGLLLQALVFAKRPRRVLEIGTAHGLSGCYLASALPENSSMVSIEWDEATATEAQANFDEAELPVKVISGDALKVIDDLADDIGQFDMVFLDANKDGYYEQVQRLISHGLLYPNCLIVADNVTDRASEMGEFLEFVKQYNAVTISTECGLLVVNV